MRVTKTTDDGTDDQTTGRTTTRDDPIPPFYDDARVPVPSP